MHLLIPYAASQSEGCQHALAGLTLPHLDRLLKQLTPAGTDRGDEHTLVPPHERAMAAALGIGTPGTTPDGLWPWGAWHASQLGQAITAGQHWAVITPCHWAVQTNHITMVHPRALDLQEAESRQLLAAMQPYFQEDGIHLVFDTATRWLACGEVFADLATASPYRVVGARVDDWIPKGDAAKGLRRLQQEMQMLLYTHALTDARSERGLPAINSFWVSGTGALPSTSAPTGATTPTVPNALRDAAIRDDWQAWVNAWHAIDSGECQSLLADVNAGRPVSLTLCGERSAQTFQSDANGAFQRILRKVMNQISPSPTKNVLSSL